MVYRKVAGVLDVEAVLNGSGGKFGGNHLVRRLSNEYQKKDNGNTQTDSGTSYQGFCTHVPPH